MPPRRARRPLAALIAVLALGACQAAPVPPAGPRVVVEPGRAALAAPGEVALAVGAGLDAASCRALQAAGVDENWRREHVSFVRFRLFREGNATALATLDAAAADILDDEGFRVHFEHLRRNGTYRVEARAYHDPDGAGPAAAELISDDTSDGRWRSAITVGDDDAPLLDAGTLRLRLKRTHFDGASQPAGVADDGEGTCRADLNGNVVTWAGGALGPYAEGATGKAARLGKIIDLARRSDGTVFASLWDQHAVVAITPDRKVRLILGAFGVAGAATDGTKLDSRLTNPSGLALSADEKLLYVADAGNHRIVRVDLESDDLDDVGPAADDDAGYVAAYAGPNDAAIVANGGTAPNGSADGAAAAARFNEPGGLAFTAGGDLLVADRLNHRIRRHDGTSVTTIAGAAPGFANGIGPAAAFDEPFDLCADGTTIVADGTWAFLITDHWNGAIRRLAPDGSGGWAVTTWAQGDGDGDEQDELLNPSGIATDGRGRVWVGGTDSDHVNAYVTSFDRASLFDGAANPIADGPDLGGRRWVQGFGTPYRDGDARDATFKDGPAELFVPIGADPLGRVFFGDEAAAALRLLQ